MEVEIVVTQEERDIMNMLLLFDEDNESTIAQFKSKSQRLKKQLGQEREIVLKNSMKSFKDEMI